MGRLDDQTVLVTGGASGLGAAIVERFLAEGANVGVLDRSEAGSAELAKRHGERVVCTVGDVRSYDDNARAVSACVDVFGGLDTAVGNAGIWDYNVALVDLPQDKLADTFDELFHINVLGYLMLARAALEPLARSRGALIFTVSNAGFLPAGGGPLYTATKHAVVGLVRQLAFELAPLIRVNGVAPGAISTQLKGPESLGMEARRFPGERLSETASGFVPIGRMPTPAEYAGAYVFFASREDNVPATGAVLNHDGGFGVRGIGAVPRGGDDLATKLGID
ncbi:MAG: 3-(cis-5,6-dihydroxycyclohexa-1,3-dien-1-yl)propanoate dehydrogenase [Pseudomonadales bacterium]|jgi:cis-2,3-dihydrobiphenyl-2,3-diol dehydrogenase